MTTDIPTVESLMDLPTQGACFGLEIRSHLHFEYLRPGSGRPDRIYAAVEARRRGSGEPITLKLIVLLDQDSRPLAVRPARPEEALRDLWATSFWLPFDGSRSRCFEGLGKLVARVPAERLSRPREWSDLPGVVAFVADVR